MPMRAILAIWKLRSWAAGVAFINGTIGWVIEHYLKHPQFTEKGANTQRNYRRVIDHLKARLGAARIADLQPNHIRIMRDEIAATSTATADIAVMLLAGFPDDAAEFCQITLGAEPGARAPQSAYRAEAAASLGRRRSSPRFSTSRANPCGSRCTCCSTPASASVTWSS